MYFIRNKIWESNGHNPIRYHKCGILLIADLVQVAQETLMLYMYMCVCMCTKHTLTPVFCNWIISCWILFFIHNMGYKDTPYCTLNEHKSRGLPNKRQFSYFFSSFLHSWSDCVCSLPFLCVSMKHTTQAREFAQLFCILLKALKHPWLGRRGRWLGSKLTPPPSSVDCHFLTNFLQKYFSRRCKAIM